MKAALRLKEQEYSIKAPWGNIAALAWGDPSNPPVILCHGKLDASSGFRPLVSRLPTCFFYLSIDLPGNGKSDHLPKGVRYTVVDLAQQLMMQTRGLSKEATEHVLERCLVPAGDGLYRKIYTTTTTPTFCVLAKKMIELGVYEPVPFVMDEKAWPHGNYKYKIVEGGHDVHIDNPEYMADDISNFILEGTKAKL
ncbi:hypothetical protein HF086_009752 [Spodoptera exigua]|uniref:AB hydrolase-1 domain-containing protein n=1 Tax=Spodoptera exigua TaxID=7107 RepID=A0A922MBZ8_SPOEX|nr:hypothetical protein HF086_009752 [Spodoptera exigua]